MAKDKKLDKDKITLADQYRELNENQRKLLELFWQEPAVIVAIAGGLVIAAYSYITDASCIASLQYQLVRTLLVVFGTFMSWTSTLTAIKHRFFRTIWLEELKSMELRSNLAPSPMWTKISMHPRGKKHFWEKWSAEITLIYALLFITGTFAILSAVNIGYSIVQLLPKDC